MPRARPRLRCGKRRTFRSAVGRGVGLSSRAWNGDVPECPEAGDRTGRGAHVRASDTGCVEPPRRARPSSAREWLRRCVRGRPRSWLRGELASPSTMTAAISPVSAGRRKRSGAVRWLWPGFSTRRERGKQTPPAPLRAAPSGIRFGRARTAARMLSWHVEVFAKARARPPASKSAPTVRTRGRSRCPRCATSL